MTGEQRRPQAGLQLVYLFGTQRTLEIALATFVHSLIRWSSWCLQEPWVSEELCLIRVVMQGYVNMFINMA